MRRPNRMSDSKASDVFFEKWSSGDEFFVSKPAKSGDRLRGRFADCCDAVVRLFTSPLALVWSVILIQARNPRLLVLDCFFGSAIASLEPLFTLPIASAGAFLRLWFVWFLFIKIQIHILVFPIKPPN